MKRIEIRYWTVLIAFPVLMTGLFSGHQERDGAVPDEGTYTSVPCSLQNDVFRSGEKIIYTIYYNWNFIWLPAGELTFVAAEKPDYYEFRAIGRTFPSYEWFYKVEDYYEAHVDKETLLPLMSLRNVNEGDYRRFNRVKYDWDNDRAISWMGKTQDQTERTVFPIERCMYDILTMLYATRNIDITEVRPGDKIPLNIFLDEEKYDIEILYSDRDPRKKIRKMGVFQTKKFEPELIAGNVFDEENKMEIWISDDKNKIPLMIESPVSVGSVKAVLKSHQNLKYPLSSKVK